MKFNKGIITITSKIGKGKTDEGVEYEIIDKQTIEATDIQVEVASRQVINEAQKRLMPKEQLFDFDKAWSEMFLNESFE